MQETNTTEISSAEAESTADAASDPIAEAISQENSAVDTSAPEADANEDREPTAEISDLIPGKYISFRYTIFGQNGCEVVPQFMK